MEGPWNTEAAVARLEGLRESKAQGRRKRNSPKKGLGGQRRQGEVPFQTMEEVAGEQGEMVSPATAATPGKRRRPACKDCPNTEFTRLAQQKEHLRLNPGHSIAKPPRAKERKKVNCTVCGKEYASLQALKNHFSEKHNGKEGAERKIAREAE